MGGPERVFGAQRKSLLTAHLSVSLFVGGAGGDEDLLEQCLKNGCDCCWWGRSASAEGEGRGGGGAAGREKSEGGVTVGAVGFGDRAVAICMRYVLVRPTGLCRRSWLNVTWLQ